MVCLTDASYSKVEKLLQGIKFKLQTKVTAARKEGDKIKVSVEGVKDGKIEEVRVLKCLLVYACLD